MTNSTLTRPDSERATRSHQSRLLKAMKSQYPLDQQVKFLHLQADAESLLQQLQAIKQQRQATNSND